MKMNKVSADNLQRQFEEHRIHIIKLQQLKQHGLFCWEGGSLNNVIYTCG